MAAFAARTIQSIGSDLSLYLLCTHRCFSTWLNYQFPFTNSAAKQISIDWKTTMRFFNCDATTLNFNGCTVEKSGAPFHNSVTFIFKFYMTFCTSLSVAYSGFCKWKGSKIWRVVMLLKHKWQKLIFSLNLLCLGVPTATSMSKKIVTKSYLFFCFFSSFCWVMYFVFQFLHLQNNEKKSK